MKHKFPSGLLLLSLATAAMGQPAGLFQNDAIIECPPMVPPQVDAITFINNSSFNINFTNFTVSPQVYRTANTLNFTNRAQMVGNIGYQFDTGPSGNGQRRMAANFNNVGTISAGSMFNPNNFQTNFNVFFPLPAGLPRIGISATNVWMNSGSNILGKDGVFSVSGKNVDLNRANVAFEGFESPNTVFGFITNDQTGIFDGYWSSSNSFNVFEPVSQFVGPVPTTPPHFVNTPGNGFSTRTLSLTGAVAYVAQGNLNATSIIRQVAFVRNEKPGVNVNVYMFLGEMDVEWVGMRTNRVTGEVSTNYLYLFDDFGGRRFAGQPNGLFAHFNPYNFTQTFVPMNYFFHRGEANPLIYNPLSGPWPASSANGVFFQVPVGADEAAYDARFLPTTVQPLTVPNATLSNMPAKVEIVADGILNLTRTRISGPNYVSLKATNHFTSSTGAAITSPFNDINLASTNGVMNITNLVRRVIPRLEGDVFLWSSFFFVDAVTPQGAGVRVYYHVLFVDSQLNNNAQAQVQDLNLRSANIAGGSDSIVISDPMKVTRNFKVDTRRLTISTNAPTAPDERGELIFTSASVLWSPATPRLQYLTNNGAISAANAIFFGGSRSSPYYTSNFNEPYIAFVNHGNVTNEGSLIWADYFENTGLFSTALGFGSIELQSQTTRLTNGAFRAFKGDVLINTRELVVTNHPLQAGRSLSLAATTLLTDNGGTNGQTWTAGNGVYLTAQPNNGDLLSTTIIDNAVPGAEVTHVWAGQDRGCSVTGFANNAALGRLILDGGFGSQWTFSPITGVNALYVDCIEFRDFSTTTIINADGNVEGIQIDPGMKIYYAQALATDGSVAERINGANGGQFCWVSDYTGLYSSTNVVDEFGNTNTFNAALVQSCNLDSDGDGLVNCIDPSPILTSKALDLKVDVTKTPNPGAVVSWQSTPHSTNHVFYRDSMLTGNWQSLTNIINPNTMYGRLSIFDPMAPNKTRYYRVQVDAQKP